MLEQVNSSNSALLSLLFTSMTDCTDVRSARVYMGALYVTSSALGPIRVQHRHGAALLSPLSSIDGMIKQLPAGHTTLHSYLPISVIMQHVEMVSPDFYDFFF